MSYRREIVGINLPISNNNALQGKYEAVMELIDVKLLKIVIKFCSRRGICQDTKKQCKPKRCKYFKYIVLKTWLKDIQGRHKRSWINSKEYREYEAIVDFVY